MPVFRKKYSDVGFTLLCMLLLMACSRTPKGVIPEKKMRDVLVDMQIAEVMITLNPADFSGLEEKKALYQSVFNKHRVTEAEYDSSQVWYGKQLDVYMQVYKSAIDEVNSRIAMLGNVLPESTPDLNRDSLDIWNFRRYYTLSPSVSTNAIRFDMKPDAAYSSGSTFVFGMQVWGVTPQLTQPVEVRLCASSDDTTYVASALIRRNGYHEMLIRVSPLKKTQRVYGYIRLDAKATTYHKIYLDQFRLIKYRYGSPVQTEGIAGREESKN